MDSANLSPLAAQVFEILKPYLIIIASKSSEKLGEMLPEAIGKLWTMVKERFERKKEANQTINELLSNPNDQDLQGEFRAILKRLLREDNEFNGEVKTILSQMPNNMVQVNSTQVVGQYQQGESNYWVGEQKNVANNIDRSLVITGNVNNINIPQIITHQTSVSKALRNAYLNRLFSQASFLSIIDPIHANDYDTRINLAAVYTALWAKANLSSNLAERNLEDYQNPANDDNLPVLDYLNKYNRLVLLGEPGSGKSTFATFVCLCLAGEALGRADANLELLTTPVNTESDVAGTVKPRSQTWDNGNLIPVHIILRDLVASGIPNTEIHLSAEHLWRFIEASLTKAGIGDFGPYLRQELLESGGMILLDGLDEVPSADNRREQIKEMIDDFANTYSNCKILVTSRTYAYQKQNWRLKGFTGAILLPFNRVQIHQFVEKWYAHYAFLRGSDPIDAQGRAELLNKVLLQNERLFDLAQSPLLLTLMVSLHAFRGGNLPEKREELYSEAVELLLQWWEDQKAIRDADGNIYIRHVSLSAWLKVDRSQVREVLNELAFNAHSRHPDLVKTADITEEDLVGGLLRLNPKQQINPRDLVDYMSNRAGILLPKGVGIYTFPHRTFQEYLAACFLTDHDYPYKIATLAREDPYRWREVAMLAGAKAARGTPFAVWALAEELCFCDLDTSVINEKDIWGALLSAQLLVESARLCNISQPNLIKKRRISNWLVHIISKGKAHSSELVKAGGYLSILGDYRFSHTALYLPDDPMLGFIEIPSGPFYMGSNPQVDPNSADDEQPQHLVRLPSYYINKYPVTVAQFKSFVEDSGYSEFDPRSLSGNPNHPVVFVSWFDAIVYCNWITKKIYDWKESIVTSHPLFRKENWIINLPSEAEWEKAARGQDKRLYPWGNYFDQDRVNSGELGLGKISPVGCFPSGASPYGIMDMGGNVWEWTRSIKSNYPYSPCDEREDLTGNDERVLRGGAFDDLSRVSRCCSRDFSDPHARFPYYGFRLAVCFLKA